MLGEGMLSMGCEAHEGAGLPTNERLAHSDVSCFLELRQVRTKVTVGKVEDITEIRELNFSSRPERTQRCHNA